MATFLHVITDSSQLQVLSMMNAKTTIKCFFDRLTYKGLVANWCLG